MRKNGYNEYIYRMATAPTYTIDDYNRLKKAIALGAIKVKYADKEVNYPSLADMRNLLAQMAAELGLINTNDNRRFGEFSKGLC